MARILILVTLLNALLPVPGLSAASKDERLPPVTQPMRRPAAGGADTTSEQTRNALSLYHQDRFKAALPWLRAAAADRPEDTRLRRYAIYAQYHAGKLPGELGVAPEFDSEGKRDSSADQLAHALASFLRQDFDDAWMRIRTIREDADDDPYFHLLRSEFCAMLADDHCAQASAASAWALAPTDPSVISNYLRYLDEESYEQKLDLVQAGLEKWPHSLSLHLQLPGLFESLNRVEEAKASVHHISVFFAESERARLFCAGWEKRTASPAEWVAVTKEKYRRTPEDNGALIEYAKALATQGSLAHALALIEERLLTRPGNSRLRNTHSYLWGRYEEQSSEFRDPHQTVGEGVPPDASTMKTQWLPLGRALAIAQRERSLVLAYFPGEGLWKSKMDESLEQLLLSGDLDDFILARVEGHEAVGQRIFATPSVLILGEDGNLIYRAEGYRKRSRLANDLDHARRIARSRREQHPSPLWLADAEFAFSRAQDLGRAVVMYIYTDWCGPCRKMERTTFADPDVIAMLNTHFVPLRLNPDVDEHAQRKWSPGRFPTVYLVSDAGMILQEIESRSPNDLIRDLGTSVNTAVLRKKGVKEYSLLSAKKRRLKSMHTHGMHRSILAELSELPLEFREGTFTMEQLAAQAVRDMERSRRAARTVFENTDRPTWAYADLMTDYSNERYGDDQATRKRIESELKRYRDRPAHRGAVLLAYAMRTKHYDWPKDQEGVLAAFDAAIKGGAGSAARWEKANLLLSLGRERDALTSLRPHAPDADVKEILLSAILSKRTNEIEDMKSLLEIAAADWGAAGVAFSQGRSLAGRADDFPLAEELAVDWLDTSAALAEDDPHLLCHYGSFFVEQGTNLDAAVRALERVAVLAEQTGDDLPPSCLATLGWALHLRGEDERALEVMNRAGRVRGRPAFFDPEYAYRLGVIYSRLGMTALATETLARVAGKNERDKNTPAGEYGAAIRRILEELSQSE